MELTNDFVIERNIEETWTILNDLEFIAPCMPGAQLTEIEGDEYRGLVKIKVGPITANYKGKASFVEQDAVNHVARLKAEGRDPRQGNANAMVTATMEELAPTQTNVTIHTDLGLSGKIASFGRGAIEDVSKKLLGQFTDNLRDKLATGDGSVGSGLEAPASSATDSSADVGSQAAAVAGAGTSSAASAAASVADTGADQTPVGNTPVDNTPVDNVASGHTAVSNAAAGSSASVSSAAQSASDTASSAVRKINSPEAEAVDLLDVAGGAAAKRAIPAVGGLAAIVAIIWWLINR